MSLNLLDLALERTKIQIKTKSFSLARGSKSAGFLRRTNHSPDRYLQLKNNSWEK
jgi:hypothetical protein